MIRSFVAAEISLALFCLESGCGVTERDGIGRRRSADWARLAVEDGKGVVTERLELLERERRGEAKRLDEDDEEEEDVVVVVVDVEVEVEDEGAGERYLEETCLALGLLGTTPLLSFPKGGLLDAFCKDEVLLSEMAATILTIPASNLLTLLLKQKGFLQADPETQHADQEISEEEAKPQ